MVQAKLYGDRQVKVEDGPTPEPSGDQVLVRVAACGICGSDLGAYRAPREYIKNPWVLGHEATGTIEILGPGVTNWSIGDRVAVEPTIAEIDHPMTQIGRYQLSNLTHIGSPAWPGAFAEFAAAPTTNIHRIPDDIPLDLAAMTEVYAVAAHALSLFPVRYGESVVVIGSGPVGMAVAEFARISGADPLILIGMPDAQLETAKSALGARTISAESDSVAEQVAELTRGQGADVVFEAVGGTAPTIQQAIEIAAMAGRVCILGGFHQPVSINAEYGRVKELTIGWSFCYGRRGNRKEFEIVLDLLGAGKLRPGPWITHRYSLAQAVDAFAAADDRSTGSIKVIIEP